MWILLIASLAWGSVVDRVIAVVDAQVVLASDVRIAAEIRRHCSEVGFFVVTGHGMPTEQLEGLRAAP